MFTMQYLVIHVRRLVLKWSENMS